eukprot:CAMPEP_0119384006 /NCGR_PEP_ID=MMETSP1334-20130426/83109_1 /TAXON_ID=127549 /ORGANISM="Calcidiscus leptoporus, Strain RCC1130" /LENGTH=63 /DNA_ID=CAMNT_0007404951 /DNA_START=82 /DNA_END=269 /DNA_ORIENTATION=-
MERSISTTSEGRRRAAASKSARYQSYTMYMGPARRRAVADKSWVLVGAQPMWLSRGMGRCEDR